MNGSQQSVSFGVQQRLVAEGTVIVGLLLWWAASRALSDDVLPNPYAVLARTVEVFTAPSLMIHWIATLSRVFCSVTIAMVVGFCLALAAQRSSWFDAIISDRILVVMNAMPSLGWAILSLIWFRVSNASVVFVEVMILLPFCYTNLVAGLKNLDNELVEMGHSFTRSRFAVLRKIIVPLLLPFVVASLRASHGICWKISLIAELFGTQVGLGKLMLDSETIGDTTTIFASCFAVFFLYMAGEKLLINPIGRLAQVGSQAGASR